MKLGISKITFSQVWIPSATSKRIYKKKFKIHGPLKKQMPPPKKVDTKKPPILN